MKKILLSLCMAGIFIQSTTSFALQQSILTISIVTESDTSLTQQDNSSLTEQGTDNATDAPEEMETPTLPSEPVDGQTLTYHLWAEEQITYARTQGLLLSSLSLDYTVNITRLQIAELLVNMIEQYTGTELSYGEVVFSDTDNIAVQKASQLAIVGGKTPELFFPEDFATRQEIAVMMYSTIKNMESLTGKTLVNHDLIPLSGYEDFSTADAWAKISIAILSNHNIMVGHNGLLSPRNNTSIQECIVLVNNLYKLS